MSKIKREIISNDLMKLQLLTFTFRHLKYLQMKRADLPLPSQRL